MAYKLPKCARLSGVKPTAAIFENGRHCGKGIIRCTYLLGQSEQRVLVAAPKKLFKRAVDRNLLKRRIREAYRLNRSILAGAKIHIALRYASKDIKPYKDIEDGVRQILQHLSTLCAVGVDSDTVVNS